MTATIRKRNKDEAPVADSICTPKWLNDKLGRFDLDPCSNERSTVNADWAYGLYKHLDGLRLPWRGRVFENHPYNDPEPWMLKSIHELTIGNCIELVVLAKEDSSTAWWKIITQPIVFAGSPHAYFPELWKFDERIEYDEPEELIEMRRAKRRAAILRVEQEICPRDACLGKGLGQIGQACDTRSGAPHIERIKAAGMKSIPTETSSNNFCSVIIHHRGPHGHVLDLDDVATRWVRPINDLRLNVGVARSAVNSGDGSLSSTYGA